MIFQNVYSKMIVKHLPKVASVPHNETRLPLYESRIRQGLHWRWKKLLKNRVVKATIGRKYARMNDIWLIGKHRALLSIEDLVSMVADFKCMCPRNATRQKTAVVVEPGLTEAIVQLWIKEAENRIPFTCRVFHTIAEAEKWVGSSVPTVAQERAHSDTEREEHASLFSKFM